MRLPDEQEERGMGIPVIYTIVAVSVFILIILAVVFMSNTRQSGLFLINILCCRRSYGVVALWSLCLCCMSVVRCWCD